MVRMSTQRILQALVMSACLFSLAAYADTNDSGIKVKWDYIGNLGPTRWGQLDPSFAVCSSGRSQSPINIVKKVKTAKDSLTLDYQAAPLVIVNNGITEVLMGYTQTIINDGHSVQLNFPTGQASESIRWDGNDYRLVELHLHSPSENQWHGQSYPMEIHFVHQGERGHIAMIGVFVKGGKDNPVLQKMIDHLPKEKGKVLSIEGQQVNPIDLMPVMRDHYTFTGSLTTPPCTEGVRWIVMSEAITASPAQIVSLRKAAGGVNARPVQPLNGRVISYSAAAK